MEMPFEYMNDTEIECPHCRKKFTTRLKLIIVSEVIGKIELQNKIRRMKVLEKK
jgi:DNA-directed RNA polymerase subunit RPC12/RpoP